MKQWRIYFSGRVQGVGFRYTCQQAANRFRLSGWVRNLPDGRVELMVEGQRPLLGSMLSWIRENNRGEILDEQKSESECVTENGASDFRIRHL